MTDNPTPPRRKRGGVIGHDGRNAGRPRRQAEAVQRRAVWLTPARWRALEAEAEATGTTVSQVIDRRLQGENHE